jgi:alkylation response protein AidB-like acyl-CoA dehydrogenase
MYFLPTDEQRELQRGVRDVLEAAYPIDKLPDGFDAGVWSTLADTGVFSLRADLGLGFVEAVLVFEELGRSAFPGPLVGTFLTAGRADGPVTVVDPRLSPIVVAHLDVANKVLVLDPGNPRLAHASDLSGVPVEEPIDPLSPLHELTAVSGGAPFAIGYEQLMTEGALLTAAIQVGLAARLTELAVDYAKTREQFDRPIGSFQAVKHICADMLVKTELARASLHSAAVMLDDPEAGDADRAVAGAKLLADEAATGNSRSCVQVHGGMGFTWEVPVHYLLKRTWLHATEFGTADEHAEALAALL